MFLVELLLLRVETNLEVNWALLELAGHSGSGTSCNLLLCCHLLECV